MLQELLAAYNLRPRRAEPLYELARYFRQRQTYGMALLFARAGAHTPRPDDRLFVAESDYTWRLLDELSVAAYWVGDFATCRTACETLLERVQQGVAVPADDLARIRANLSAAAEKLAR